MKKLLLSPVSNSSSVAFSTSSVDPRKLDVGIHLPKSLALDDRSLVISEM